MKRIPHGMVTGLAMLAALGLLVLLAACQAEAKPAGPVQLDFWSYMDRSTGQALQAVVDDFNASQSRIKVTVEVVPIGNLKQKLQVAGKAGELPDLTIIDNPDHSAFASLGVFEDLTDRAATWEGNQAFFPGPLKSTIYQGRQYGLPLSSNCLALFYNKKMLDEAGVAVPQTWDELRLAAKKLTVGERFGMAISAVGTEEGTFQFIPWLLSAGASVDRLDSPEARKALGILRQLIEDKSMSRDVIEWTQGFVEKQFAIGRTAMMVNGPWNIDVLRSDAPDMDFGVAKIPRDKEFASVLGGENVAICKGAPVDAAWEFLTYLDSPAVMDKFITLSGYFPPRKDVAAMNQKWSNDPILKVFMEQMQFAWPRGPHPKWPQISEIIYTTLQDGLLGISPVDELLARAQEKLDGLGQE